VDRKGKSAVVFGGCFTGLRLKEFTMSYANQTSGFGTLLSTLAALTALQLAVASRPAYDSAPRSRRASSGRVKTALARAWGRYERVQVRRALEQLDDRLLRDIGVTRAEVNAGLLPPFTRPEEPAVRKLGRDLARRW
jgi:uncharacterized protein YjiS (DUF1127 family)